MAATLSFLRADNDFPRGPVTVGRDVIVGSSSSTSVSLDTPMVNTMYVFTVSLSGHNLSSASVAADIVYTDAIGNSRDINLVNAGGGGNTTTANIAPIYAKAGTSVGVTTTFTGSGGTYDLDAFLVKQ
jgi:hypothetical protein